MADGLTKMALGIFGFGFCKASLSAAYMTAMGSVFSTVGFVSELNFMVPMLVSSLLTVSALVLMVRSRRLLSGALRQYPAVISLSSGFLLSAGDLLSRSPDGFAAALCGALCGYSSTILNAVWLDVFAAEEDTASSTVQIVGALIVQCIASPLLVAFGRFWSCALPILSVGLSSWLLSRKKRTMSFPEHRTSMPAVPPERRDLTLAYLCVFALVGVVGILHIAVLGSQSEHLVGDVDMRIPLAAATLVTLLLALIARRSPHPASVYNACLPLLLLILSLLPFLGDGLGGLGGLVMIACYDACSMVFLLYIVDSARRLDLSTYILSAAYLGGSALSLLTGLGVGSILRSLSVDYGLSLLTLLAFAAIYPLAGVLVFGISKARRQLGPRTSDSEEDSVTDCTHPADTPMPDEVSEGEANASDSNSIDNAFEGGVEGIAVASGLTRREREILGYLARGRSARYIAEDLVLSENTVWAHIKRIYSKTGVHTKQELMSIVEKMAEGKQ
ncbi:response regulator transcription factor [Adlercreutzia equolifaciens]|uniref:helix-turn-helix transcriptional regulator n=1 Tax=Adlercreutzia equolifaciens TaxID=446660 RepID=UPI003AF1B696